ncbi:5-oxoprolinase/urea amidolyase family protein [Rubellimicrobium rubrum]|uniref:5-oxoprolinase/urea amidolyase family protein n=1 Tax=Rubellimicrobium rubrum TaxID=2585369 RepID=A0A5C4MP72_9RHOB|nr:5-oxoprolinase/urea amidolyase family protein [Rubellimicrobium rubrum]TNC47612.1 5-oxoprolinase/urea amidolyase family protein [Rubellimicrobium rubrum]
MFKSVLVANRGEIAVRIIRTLRAMGISPVAVWSDADRFAPHVRLADQAVRLGPAPAAESYLNAEAVIAAAKATGAEAVHPGYGFLSENADFAEALAAAGITFIGPSPPQIRAFGLKHTARELAQAAGVTLLPGTGLLPDVDAAVTAAAALGYPVMLKSTAGGGGIGMSRCDDEAALRAAFQGVERTAKASFGDARVYLERFIARARHVEVQVFGNGHGRVVALGERDCSLQRRNQKVIEETPAPRLPDALRRRLLGEAEALCASVGYASAGTVEFIYDPDREETAFLEVNTRLQVEHPVTEAVLGIDLVEWMVRQAAGEDPIPAVLPQPRGHAIEARLYAEQPHAGFRPSAGRLTEVAFPEGVRVDGWIETGTVVEPYYDPMLAKIIVHGPDRPAAITTLRKALAAARVAGVATNLAYLSAIAESDIFWAGDVTTSALAAFSFAPQGVEVLAPGAQSSLQELPGRRGLWHVGVPPSGPMDPRSLRNANRLLGNPPDTAALELTMTGPTLRFLSPARVALAGARMRMELNGAPMPGLVVDVPVGGVLALGSIEGPGQRAYLAVEGGFAAPEILESRATFALGGFGGHATGVLRTGDFLTFAGNPVGTPAVPEPAPLTRDWTLSVVYGPHGAPDFFAPDDIETLFSSPYDVHHNSDRTGVRLIGPPPRWARADGGEAGLHPSNLHDNAYAVGAIDFTGDMPILLGPDGPSLGGFVCPGVVAAEDLWKLGQLRPGDTVRFIPAERPADPVAGPAYNDAGSPIMWQAGDGMAVTYRRQGDENLLVEYGPITLAIALRLRVHLLMRAVAMAGLPVIDLTPGIRSLQIHYDSTRITRLDLIAELQRIEAALPMAGSVRVPSRIVHLPLSWNDPQAELAMRKYQELVRPNAPWCPSNIEFIRRINGLTDEAEVQRTILDARYLVLGLGDVYLGAPVATPVDPRQRLVTTKYNPARTWTPENAVGIGGAYMCIYGMEGPGGYQLFGRTVQVWNTWRRTPVFAGRPWLLDFFDQIRFHLVSPEELADARTAFPYGAYPLQIEETVFDWSAEEAALSREEASITTFKARQQAAFEAERTRWREEGLDSFTPFDAPFAPAADLPPGCIGVENPVPGSLWKFLAVPGARVMAGEPVAIIESMKMEFAVNAPVTGRLRSVNGIPGRTVRAGEILAVIESE